MLEHRAGSACSHWPVRSPRPQGNGRAWIGQSRPIRTLRRHCAQANASRWALWHGVGGKHASVATSKGTGCAVSPAATIAAASSARGPAVPGTAAGVAGSAVRSIGIEPALLARPFVPCAEASASSASRRGAVAATSAAAAAVADAAAAAAACAAATGAVASAAAAPPSVTAVVVVVAAAAAPATAAAIPSPASPSATSAARHGGLQVTDKRVTVDVAAAATSASSAAIASSPHRGSRGLRLRRVVARQQLGRCRHTHQSAGSAALPPLAPVPGRLGVALRRRRGVAAAVAAAREREGSQPRRAIAGGAARRSTTQRGASAGAGSGGLPRVVRPRMAESTAC